MGAVAQTGEWTWLSGNKVLEHGQFAYVSWPGVYGTLGSPSPTNLPGGRGTANNWTDKDGNLWLFGGIGADANGTQGYLNDLWKFYPTTNQWSWIGGTSTVPGYHMGTPGIYGTLGIPAAANAPGGRESAISWTDGEGNFWLFGGYGFDSVGNVAGELNDLWKLDVSSNEWAWMGGSSTLGSNEAHAGVYGTLGIPSRSNIPGSRDSAVGWTDTNGNLWLFGGYGNDSTVLRGELSDLWMFDCSTFQWTWLGGSSTRNQLGVYGGLGEPSSANNPGGRQSSVSWKDTYGKLWLFGGEGFDSSTPSVVGILNDIWMLDPSTLQWTWMGGSSTIDSTGGQPGIYGTLATASPTNAPGSRYSAVAWTDDGGNFWLSGGMGFDSTSYLGALNDLWEFSPLTNEWTWIAGSKSSKGGAYNCYSNGTICGQLGIYGTLGTPGSGNVPGSRLAASSWADTQGNLWLFGGAGFDSAGNFADLNDMWEYASLSTELPTPAAMTSPTPGSTLTGSSTTFTWTAGSGATAYYLFVGTTPGGYDLVNIGPKAATSSTVSLPTNGATIYVRLYSVINGGLQYHDYTYTEFTGTPAAMTSPAPGSMLTGSSTTFIWTTGSGATAYYLFVGTTTGGYDLVNIGPKTATSATVSLPTNGATIYVRLWSVINGGLQFHDYTYTEFAGSPAAMTSPAPGSTLTGATTTFTWTAGSGATAYYLFIGTAPGGYDLVNIGPKAVTSATVSLPTNGATIYVRLWSVINGGLQYHDYTYTEFTGTPAAMTSPAPGSTLTDSSTFIWTTGSGATAYYLFVGTTPGGYDLVNIGPKPATSATVSLPTNGATIYLRLYSVINGGLQYHDYTYTEAH
ncbi:MAG TPA: kelch repeat-containing protein [Terracidiphilus sp.]|nr:kelch repeat-containing protein [Terracidiphilus sp.]